MKNIIGALLIISISLIVVNCTNEEMMPAQGKVQFGVAVSSKPSDGGRVLSQPFPEGSYISLSIKTASNASVYSLKRIELIELGDSYITAPFELAEGSYQVTDFFVMSAGGEVLYATPKEGSDLATLVTDPLPIPFIITTNGIVNLNVQVVDAAQQSAEDFGYLSFSVEMVGGDFSISAFTTENNTLSYTSAILRLYQGTELVYSKRLLAKANSVNYKGDPDTEYTLLVEKEGYTLTSRKFVWQDLVYELHGSPLAIMLSPATTFTFLAKEPTHVGLRLSTMSGDIYIDWGDGNVERGMITSGYFMELHHEYDGAGRYYVNISGDLGSITKYEFIYIHYDIGTIQSIETIDITRLGGLKSFQLSWHNSSPKRINFSHNEQLEFIDVSYSSITSLYISRCFALNFLNVTSTNLVPRDNPSDLSNLTNVIDTLWIHAAYNNVKGGTFSYKTWWNGTLPVDSKEKLLYLKNVLEWSVTPTPQ